MKKLKIGDFVALAVTVGLIVFLSFAVYGSSEEAPVAYIVSDMGEWFFPLDEEQEVGIPGRIGETRVQISGGTVKVLDSPCPDKVCVHAWPLEHDGDWTACLPNQVFLQVRGSVREAIDAVSY